jgi:hypothetical protein
MPPEKAVEVILREAIARGEFDNLPGKGKPVDLSAYFDTPEDLRMAYSIMKNAGVLPKEVELLKEIEALSSELETAADAGQRKRLEKEIEERKLKVSLLMESWRKRQGKS